MVRKIVLSVILASGLTSSSLAQQHYNFSSSPQSVPVQTVNSSANSESYYDPAYSEPLSPSPYTPVIPWQEQAASGGSAGGGEGGGQDAGAAAANNPALPLSQLQFQNVFIPESYASNGYAHQFVVQPVIAIKLNPRNYFEYHIVRATLPILAPVADPDGPVPDLPGTGDITYFDLYFPTAKKEGVTFGYGPVAILPSASNPGLITGERQTGLGEWQLGPAVVLINASKKGWVFGGLMEIPFSLESDAYAVLYQPILTRLLKDDKYIAIGDLLWKFEDQNGNYNIPLSFKIGKVVKAGKQPINIFIQPEFTPQGLTSQPTSKYGVKLSISFLLPGAEFGYSEAKAAKKSCKRGCLGCRHCR